MFSRTAIRSRQVLNAYSVFMTQVHKTNNFPAVKAAIKRAIKAKGITASGKVMGKAYKALSPKQKNAMKAAGSKIKQTYVSKKAKYLKSMNNSPAVKGLKPAAKQKKLAKMWRLERKSRANKSA